MYTLLIVDDERHIVDWLYELFCMTAEPEMDILRAYSAPEALRWLDSVKVDIVLSDIRMPGMDGLQMLERIKSTWPECHVIFLTGYDEFDYLYRATQFKADGYILKSESDKKIIGAVQEAVAQIEKGLKAGEIAEKAKEAFEKALPLLRKDFLLSLVKGEITDMDKLAYQIQELDIPLSADTGGLLLLGRADRIMNQKSSTEMTRSIYSVGMVVERYLGASAQTVYTVDENSIFVCLVQPKVLKSRKAVRDFNFSSFVKDTLELIQACCRETLECTLSFAVASQMTGLSDMGEKYDELRQLLNCRIGFEGEFVLTDKYLAEMHEENEFIAGKMLQQMLNRMRTGKLEMCLESLQKAEFFKQLTDLTNAFNSVQSMNFNPALELYYSIALMYLSYINRWNLTDRLAFRIGLGGLMHLNEYRSWAQASEYLFKLGSIIFEIQSSEQGKRADDVVTRVKLYIAQNLNRDISLSELAEKEFFNSSYLSRLFKNATGVNLFDYIFNERIEKARQLLSSSDEKIQDIGAAVGFESPQYFNRAFKKATGLTPQSYRQTVRNRYTEDNKVKDFK